MGLSHDQVAAQSGLSIGASAIWDIEACEGDLENYSPAEIRKLCSILGVQPVELFGGGSSEAPVSANELVQRIRDECLSRGLTLQQFEDVVGWALERLYGPAGEAASGH